MALDTGLLSVVIGLWNSSAVLQSGAMILAALYAMYKLVVLPSEYMLNGHSLRSYSVKTQPDEEFWNAS